MPLLHRLYPLVRPALFQLDAETAHEWTIKLLRAAHFYGWLPGPTRGAIATAGPMTFDLAFPNALGLAAGMDKGARAIDAWHALGFGFVEVGTLTPRPQPGNPTPRLFRLIPQRAVINRMGFNNPGIHTAVGRIERRQGDGIVGINIGKNFDTPNERAVDDYLICLRAAQPVADYIAVNISSPNTKGLRDLQAEEPVRRLLGTLMEENAKLTEQNGRRVPLLVKIAPDLDTEQIQALARVVSQLQLDGLIATNTTLSRQGVEANPKSREAGGLSGAPLRERATEVIRVFRELLPASIPIIGVGGISSRAHAQEKQAAGAALVQIYTGLVYQGPSLVQEIVRFE